MDKNNGRILWWTLIKSNVNCKGTILSDIIILKKGLEVFAANKVFENVKMPRFLNKVNFYFPLCALERDLTLLLKVAVFILLTFRQC